MIIYSTTALEELIEYKLIDFYRWVELTFLLNTKNKRATLIVAFSV